MLRLLCSDNARGFRIQCASDLHLEFGSKPTITPRAPYLALLGDTSVVRYFI